MEHSTNQKIALQSLIFTVFLISMLEINYILLDILMIRATFEAQTSFLEVSVILRPAEDLVLHGFLKF